MTEEILTELKSKVKELAAFLKANNFTTANIQLSELANLTVCNAEYSNDESVENFTYFFESKDLYVDSISKNSSKNSVVNEENNKEKNKNITTTEDTSNDVENSNLKKSKEEISVTLLNSDNDMCLEEISPTTTYNDTNKKLNTISTRDAYTIPQKDTLVIDDKIDSEESQSNLNENNNKSNIIDFNEEDIFQKNIIARILKENNILV